MNVKDFNFDLPQELIAQDPFFFQAFSTGQEDRQDTAQDL